MPGHGENPIFFNKKDKDWTPSILANPPPLPPHPFPKPDNISFLPYPPHLTQSGRNICITSYENF